MHREEGKVKTELQAALNEGWQDIEAGALIDGTCYAPERGGRSGVLVVSAIELIRERLPDITTVSQVSLSLGVSREHVSRSFRRHLGCSVWDFVTELRIEKAKRLLGSPMLVKEIAREVGFSSGSSFSRAFRKRVGVHPTQYRFGAPR